jgi:hypothetical protein
MGTQNASHRDESGVTAASEGFHAAEWKVGGFGSLPRLGSVTSLRSANEKNRLERAGATGRTGHHLLYGPSDLAAITQKDDLGGYSNWGRDQFAPGHPIEVEQNEYSRRTGRRLAEARTATG